MAFTNPVTWFVSHPSGGMQHTPAFFSAVSSFAGEQEKVQIVFPHTADTEVIATKQSIEACQLVLVEVSIPSTGSGIELGWANAAGKPVVAFHQGGSQPSPSVKFVTQEIHVYVTEQDILNVLRSLSNT